MLVDTSSLTLYVTIVLSVISNTRQHIYVMHTAYYNSGVCKKKKKDLHWDLSGLGTGVCEWVGMPKEVT